MPSPHFKGMGDTILGIFKEEIKALFKPKDGYVQEVVVIFNAAHQAVDLSGQEFGAPNPTAWVRTGTIDAKYQDKIEIAGKEYSIVNVAQDGLELTQLDLDDVQ